MRMLYKIKNLLIFLLGSILNILLVPVVLVVVLIKHVNKLATNLDRVINNFKLKGKSRKK